MICLGKVSHMCILYRYVCVGILYRYVCVGILYRYVCVGILYRYVCVGIYAYVILRDGVLEEEEVIVQSLKMLIKKKIGSFAVPQKFLVGPFEGILQHTDPSPPLPSPPLTGHSRSSQDKVW